MVANAGPQYSARALVWMDILSTCLRGVYFRCSPESVSEWTLEAPLFFGLHTRPCVPRNTFCRRSVQSALSRPHKTSSQRKRCGRLDSEYLVLSLHHPQYLLGLSNEEFAMVSVLRRRIARTVSAQCPVRGRYVDQRGLDIEKASGSWRNIAKARNDPGRVLSDVNWRNIPITLIDQVLSVIACSRQLTVG